MTQQFMNRIELVGRVGQDPAIHYFESGAMKATLALAVKPPYKSDSPMWWDLELWGNTAQVATDWVRKGSTIGVAGELKFDVWVDKNSGLPRSKPVIRVSELELISSSKRGEETNTSSNSPEPSIANANF
ncbi:MAG: Single-stranded DNA-binding protein [Chroococcidiopsis cubana SAG 39.79]|uniref:Single-stranded DNA-binding protein n=2 Tax=Chroococcidiopsis TaxID=54298 RepID=A0AB37UB93_9CYAN|nr:single-stranded DNA-binding protein [Chroococcidiopsis cubana]MDZ4870737.1 Single-stranded DNA-binding protein [Chroococcidiopsis cubana SAG 39.79]RUT03293.1 single-stranded DNA-binding protein [Chroococcidiopsis cubana SAG 39.79]